VVVGSKLAKHPAQMGLTEHNQMVERPARVTMSRILLLRRAATRPARLLLRSGVLRDAWGYRVRWGHTQSSPLPQEVDDAASHCEGRGGYSAFLLSLDLRWHACRVHNFGGTLWITGAKTVGGMSGSTIIDKDGRAIGVVCTGSNSKKHQGLRRAAHPPHAFLTALDDAAAVANRTRRENVST
jgi:hypothetical protein